MPRIVSDLPPHSMCRSIRAVAVAAIGALLVLPAAKAEPARYLLDREHFTVSFLVSHAGFARVLGSFLDVQGEFEYDHETNSLARGNVVIQAESLFTNHDKRDQHVRNRDFLDVGEHPVITFTATQWLSNDDGTGTLTGDLMLLGTTRPVALDVTINRIGEHPMGGGLFRGKPFAMGASMRGVVSRSDYGMTYALEDGLVGDEVELLIEFEAIRQ